MKGIILAGGSGSRLLPLTATTSKQLLPVYDKPMIYYPLSTLMLAGIRNILIITSPENQNGFESLLGDGSKFGVKLTYEAQPSPDGIAQAFLIGERFIDGDSCALILGDNIFYGNGLKAQLVKARKSVEQGAGSVIFGYYVPDPDRFGVMELGADGRLVSIEEKPSDPKSNYCVTGLYFYNSDVCKLARQLKPSRRGELEITDLNNLYMAAGGLEAVLLGRGYAWFDAGTVDALMDAGNFIRTVETHQGIVISAPEEIAYVNGWIDQIGLLELATRHGLNQYARHLRAVVDGKLRY